MVMFFFFLCYFILFSNCRISLPPHHQGFLGPFHPSFCFCHPRVFFRFSPRQRLIHFFLHFYLLDSISTQGPQNSFPPNSLEQLRLFMLSGWGVLCQNLGSNIPRSIHFLSEIQRGFSPKAHPFPDPTPHKIYIPLGPSTQFGKNSQLKTSKLLGVG